MYRKKANFNNIRRDFVAVYFMDKLGNFLADVMDN